MNTLGDHTFKVVQSYDNITYNTSSDSFEFKESGTYTITVTVTDDDGAEASAHVTLVFIQPPEDEDDDDGIIGSVSDSVPGFAGISFLAAVAVAVIMTVGRRRKYL